MKRKGSEVITRITTIAILSALAFVLMAFVRIPYPLAPWLQIEFSDMVVLIGYALYGLPGGLAIAVLKTGLDLAIHGLTDGLGIGHLTALFTSLIYVLGLFLCSHVFAWFKKGLKFRILAYSFIILLVSVLLTFMNGLFITPSYLMGSYTTAFNSEAVEGIISFFQKSGYPGESYFLMIFLAYFPFNLIKGLAVCVIYELIFNRIIFVLMERSPFLKKYFVGPIFKEKKKEENDAKTQEVSSQKDPLEENITA